MKRMISLFLVVAIMFGMVSFIPAFDEKNEVSAATIVTVPVYNEDFEGYSSSVDFQARSGWSGEPMLRVDSTKYISLQPGANENNSVTFEPIPLSAAGGQSPGKNAKVIAEYRINCAGDRGKFWAGFGDSAAVMGVCASSRLSSLKRSDICYSTDGLGTVLYKGGGDVVIMIYPTLPPPWVTIKYEMQITDADGSFITPNVTAFVNTASSSSSSRVPLGNMLNSIDTLSCIKLYSDYSFLNIDDIHVSLVKEEGVTTPTATPTVAPTPTPTPAPTPEPTATPTPTAVPSTINKTVLAAKIAVAEFVYNKYSQMVWIPEAMPINLSAYIDVLQMMLQNAKAVFNNINATQASVDEQVGNLQAAIQPFQMNADLGIPEEGIVRINVTGVFNPKTENKVVMVKGLALRYVFYNGVYKFVALVSGSVEADDITVAEGTPIELKYGDVNLNGVVDTSDINNLKGRLVGNRTPANSFESLASGVMGNDTVASSDLNALKGFVVGNIAVFAAYNK